MKALLETTATPNATLINSTELSAKESIQQKRIQEINEIFATILADESYLMSLMQNKNREINQFRQKLHEYEVALINEVNTLPAKYTHPLRAARALATLIDPEEVANFSTNLTYFNEQAANSYFHPTTRLALIAFSPFIIEIFALAALVAVSFVLSAATLNPLPFLLIILAVTIPSAAIVIGSTINSITNYEMHQESCDSVYKSKSAAKSLGLFFQPATKNETLDNMESENEPWISSAARFLLASR